MQRVSWRVMSNLSDSLSSSQDDNKSKKKKKQRKISLDTWDNVVRQSLGGCQLEQSKSVAGVLQP